MVFDQGEMPQWSTQGFSPELAMRALKPEFVLNGSAEAELYVNASVQALLYSTAGLEASFLPSVGVEGEFAFSNSPEPLEYEWGVFGQLKSEIKPVIEFWEDDWGELPSWVLLDRKEKLLGDKFPKLELAFESVPGDMMVTTGSDIVLSVGTNDPDNAALSYEWTRDGKLLPVRGRELFLKRFSEAQTGAYTVSAIRGDERVTSRFQISGAAQSVPLAFESVPPDFTIGEGESLTLIVSTNDPDNPEISYEWIREGDVLPVTGNTLVLTNLSEDEAGAYLVAVARGEERITTSFEIALTQEIPDLVVEILEQPESQVVIIGDSFNLDVALSTDSDIAYQWYQNGELIPGAEFSRYRVNDANAVLHSGDYFVRIGQGDQFVDSEIATIVVGENRMVPVYSSSGVFEMDFGQFRYTGNFGLGGIALRTQPLPNPGWLVFSPLPEGASGSRPSRFRQQPPELFFDDIVGIQRDFISGTHLARFSPVPIASIQEIDFPNLDVVQIVAEFEFDSPKGSGNPLHPDVVWWAASSLVKVSAGIWSSTAGELFYSVAQGQTYDFRSPSSSPYADALGSKKTLSLDYEGGFPQEISVKGEGSYTAGFRPETYGVVIGSEEWDGWVVDAIHRFPYSVTIYAEVVIKDPNDKAIERSASWYADQLKGIVTAP